MMCRGLTSSPFFLSLMKVDKTYSLNPQMQKQKLEGQLRKASEMYEKQFLRQMVQAMRQSVDHSAMTKPSFAEGIYRGQMDDHYVDQWSDRGGVGFAEMVYQQLVDRYYPQLAPQKQKQIRPVDITDRYQGMTVKKNNKQETKTQFEVQLKSPEPYQKSYLKVPWQAELDKEFTTEDGQRVVQFNHPMGLKSTFVFKGQFLSELPDHSLKAGENFALLSPEAQNFTWQVQGDNSRKDPAPEESSSFSE